VFKASGAVWGIIAAAACLPPPDRPLVEPVSVRFPLVEAGRLDLDGAVAGPIKTKDGLIYFATRDGWLTAAAASSRAVFWRFRADHPVSAGPELAGERVLLRDDGQVLYVLDGRGGLFARRPLSGTVTTAVRADRGRAFFGTGEGRVAAFDIDPPRDGGPVWEYRTSAAVTAGPVFCGDLVLFGLSDGRLVALARADGRAVWTFEAEAAVEVDPAVGGGRVYFGTAGKRYYGLEATTGRTKWSRRLQGSPLHAASVGDRVAVVGSNSVLYFLSRRGGSIISWSPVPSRIVFPPAPAGRVLLVASAGPRMAAYDPASGRGLGEHLTTGSWASAPVWAPPYVLAVEEDRATGRQSLVFLAADEN